MEAVFHLTRTYWKRGNEIFICFLSIVLFRIFFCKWKLLLKLRGSQSFKDEPYSCQWTLIFSIFQRFFKVEAAFPYGGNVFFNILYPASETDFLPSGNSGQCYFTVSRNHYWNMEKTVLREKAHSC